MNLEKVKSLGCKGCFFNNESLGHCVGTLKQIRECHAEGVIYVDPAKCSTPDIPPSEKCLTQKIAKMFEPKISPPEKCSAPDILASAKQHMDARAATYDAPQGERSMTKTVAAFNALTGHTLTEADGFLLMAVLKIVRDRQNKPHKDSLEDLVAYCALMAEARLK